MNVIGIDLTNKKSTFSIVYTQANSSRKYIKAIKDLTSNSQMTLNLNCKDAGDPVCTHTMYGDTEEELLV
jgi:hypothetical protein